MKVMVFLFERSYIINYFVSDNIHNLFDDIPDPVNEDSNDFMYI